MACVQSSSMQTKALNRRPRRDRVQWLHLASGLMLVALAIAGCNVRARSKCCWPSRRQPPLRPRCPRQLTRHEGGERYPHGTITRTPTITLTPSPSLSPTITPTPTETLPPTRTPTITPTPEIRGRVLEQANCRYGPGAAYLYEWGLYPANRVTVLGRNQDGSWLYVDPWTYTDKCW